MTNMKIYKVEHVSSSVMRQGGGEAVRATGAHRALLGIACAFALALACFAVWFAAPQAAYADNAQLDAPVTVSDDITRLHVNKLDANNHEYVAGATMAIINEKTGEVVDSWVTGKETHQTEKMLNAGETYILRELAAPEGYEKVPDVRFKVNEIEGQGITILSGEDSVDLSDSYKLAVYDKPLPVVKEQTVTETTPGKEITAQKTTENTSKVVAPKTGDETPLSLVAALMGLGVSIILILQLVKRRIED